MLTTSIKFSEHAKRQGTTVRLALAISATEEVNEKKNRKRCRREERRMNRAIKSE